MGANSHTPTLQLDTLTKQPGLVICHTKHEKGSSMGLENQLCCRKILNPEQEKETCEDKDINENVSCFASFGEKVILSVVI